ncbi:MAG TPA: beta-galactosidase, partial [Chloroflexota bacterium]|nr:beta-galactosidase [Chloroflexota bacterium]
TTRPAARETRRAEGGTARPGRAESPAASPAATLAPADTAPAGASPAADTPTPGEVQPAATPAPTLPPASATASPQAVPTAPPLAVGGPKQARGVIAVTQHDVAFLPATFTNASVDGIMIRTFWSSVEPTEGHYDWSFLDGQVSTAASHGKKAVVVVLPGAFTPSWAAQGVQMATFSSKYGFTAGQPLTLPLPWDQTYLKRWFTFVQTLGQRYDSNPAVMLVPAAGPTSISAEMSLPDGSDAVAQWRQLGYTPQKFIDAWAQTVAAYVQAFPTTQIALTLYPGLPIPDASASDETRTTIPSAAEGKYGSKITIQTSGLSARKEDKPRIGYQTVQQYSQRTTVGFEMGTSATERPDRMGGQDATSALRGSIDFGLQAGAKYLEIYEKDVDNPGLQSIISYAHTALDR